LALGVAVYAQTAPDAPAREGPPGITRPTGHDPVAAFLERRARDQQRRLQALDARGKGAGLRELNGLLRGAKLAPAGLGRNAAERGRLEDALAVEVAQLLAALNHDAGDVQRSRQGPVDLAEAAAAAIRGRATFQQMAALAEHIVVVEASTPLAADERGDGFASTIQLKVVESLRGSSDVGRLLDLRQVSGRAVRVSTDLTPEPGQRYLLLLSSGLYQQQALEKGGRGRGTAYVQALPGYRLEGESLAPISHGPPLVTTLAAARAAIAGLSRTSS
jgi:hypothetical protein